jgi:hypothetical protein
MNGTTLKGPSRPLLPGIYCLIVRFFNPAAEELDGLAFYNLTRNIVLVINTYVPPIAMAQVSWRFCIFYILFDGRCYRSVFDLCQEVGIWRKSRAPCNRVAPRRRT